MCPCIPVHIRDIHEWGIHLCMLLGCAVYHLACGVQPWGIHKLNFLFGAAQNGSGVLSVLECYTGY